MFWNPPKNSEVGTRLSGVLFPSKFDTACPNIPLLMLWMMVGYSWHVLVYKLLECYVLTFKDRHTTFSTSFGQIWIIGEVQSCKLNMLTYIAILNIVFPSSPCSISVVLSMFENFASVCLQLQRCHPSSRCRIHPLPRVPWTWKIKNCIMFYL